MSLSSSVSGLPQNGSTVYVRVWSLVGGTWLYHDSIFTSMNGRAQLIRPSPGARFSSTSVTFEWTAGTNVSHYWLSLGTTGEGSSNLQSIDVGTDLIRVVNGLPLNGQAIYIRLWSLVGPNWEYIDSFIVPASLSIARITSPAPDSTLNGSTVTFQWTGGLSMTQYWLKVTTQDGWTAITGQDETIQTTLSKVVAGLPTDGRPVTATLYSRRSSSDSWGSATYQYTATTSTNDRAQLTFPPPNSTLSVTTVDFEWSGGSNLTQYWLFVGSTPGGYDIYNQDRGTNLNAVVSGLPNDGRTLYVRVWGYRVGAFWEYTDYILTAASQ
jgi:serine protease